MVAVVLLLVVVVPQVVDMTFQVPHEGKVGGVTIHVVSWEVAAAQLVITHGHMTHHLDLVAQVLMVQAAWLLEVVWEVRL